MFACFECSLLCFCVSKFPAIYKEKPGTFVSDCTLYWTMQLCYCFVTFLVPMCTMEFQLFREFDADKYLVVVFIDEGNQGAVVI